MDSVSSDTDDEADSGDQEEAKEVSLKSKLAPRYDDEEDNALDDMIASLPSEEAPAVKEASPEPVESVEDDQEEEEEEEEDSSVDHTKSPSPMRSPSPDRDQATRSPTPERKDSRGSHGSSSYDEERASSLSPEPPKVIAAPASKVVSPTSPTSPAQRPASSHQPSITKIYTDKLAAAADSDDESTRPRSPAVTRARGAGTDITQIYTQKLVAAADSSPKPERAKFVRPSRDITQLYTAALSTKPEADRSPCRDVKRMGGDITKLYTGGLGDNSKPFKGKPNDERTNPTKVHSNPAWCMTAWPLT